MKFKIESVFFDSENEKLAADFYMPQNVVSPPVIIMAHGFACERRFGLPDIATEFAQRGFAVVLFDYRGFAESTGEPRELVAPVHHLKDWQNVIEQVKTWNTVNLDQLFLWGDSFSGGHVISLAAKIEGIRAIIALVPFVDGLASAMLYPPKYFLSATKLAIQDLFTIRTGKAPVRIPVIAKKGVACLAGEESYAAFMETVPADSAWTGYVPARIMLDINLYRPILVADKIKCPVLVIAAEHDTLIPFKAIQKTVKKIKNVQFEHFPITHFDMINKNSEIFAESIRLQHEFLLKYQ